ncbi:MAG: cytochrome c biogenesis CcdA family protein [Hyphomicrobiales bacterium]
MEVSYLAALTAGILSFLSPCVLPLVPPYLCFIAGTSLDQLTEGDDLDPTVGRRIFLSAVLFVLGFSTVFVLLGATASFLGQLISTHLEILSKIAGAVIIILGLNFLGVFKIAFFHREARFEGPSKPMGYIGAYVVGLAFAFGWTPCVGPVLAAVLFYAAQETSAWKGVSLLATYSIGLGIPFLIAALAAQPFLNFMQRFRKHLWAIEKLIGALLVITGILFLTGSMNEIGFWLLETFPSLGKVG